MRPLTLIRAVLIDAVMLVCGDMRVNYYFTGILMTLEPDDLSGGSLGGGQTDGSVMHLQHLPRRQDRRAAAQVQAEVELRLTHWRPSLRAA